MLSFNIGQFLLFCKFYSIKKFILPSNISIKGENTIVFRGEKELKNSYQKLSIITMEEFLKRKD